MLVTTCSRSTLRMSAEESKTAGEMRIVSSRTAGCVRQIHKHVHSEIALRRNSCKVDAREDPVACSVAVNDRREILRCEFCLFRKRPGDTDGSFFSQPYALFDLELDIRARANSPFNFLKVSFGRQLCLSRRVANRTAFITITEQGLDGRDAGCLLRRIAIGVDEVSVRVTDPAAVVGIVHIELDIPLGPAVIDH